MASVYTQTSMDNVDELNVKVEYNENNEDYEDCDDYDDCDDCEDHDEELPIEPIETQDCSSSTDLKNVPCAITCGRVGRKFHVVVIAKRAGPMSQDTVGIVANADPNPLRRARGRSGG